MPGDFGAVMSDEVYDEDEDYAAEERKLRREYARSKEARELGGRAIHRCRYCPDHPIMDEIETDILECPECGYEEAS
jgi:ribosomal protein L37AE/L43A